MPTCARCGGKSEWASAFCPFCGARLSAASRRELRKTVTMLFCDLVHSTGLAERDPEAFRRVQARYFERMSQIVERHGGTVEKLVGDEVMAVFGVPAVHEDDALRAVRAADEMLNGLAALNMELEASLRSGLQVRIGINTGEVLAGDPAEGQVFVTGEPVIVAKRLQQAAEAGEILIGEATYPGIEHAVDVGPLERISVKGKRAEVGMRRVERVHREAPGAARRLDAPIVGRDHELQLLTRAFEQAVEGNSCRLFTMIGPAGIGKSRLAKELLSQVDGRAVVAAGRCLSYGEGITFWPLAEVLRELGGESAFREALAEDDARDTLLEMLRGVTGTSATRSSEETFWAVRRTFEALARQRPLVLCFEDMHWAEETMLDLVEYVVGWSRDAPILVVALARSDLIERRPHWVVNQPNRDALTLEPLSGAATEALLVGLSTNGPPSAEVRQRVVIAAEGNPLFVEQMSAMVDEEGGDVSIPPSIQALLTERLDRLSVEERDVVERASIVGRDFSVAAVAALFPNEQRADVTPRLFSLVRKGLVRPDRSPTLDEDRFSFDHVLVREAAYEAMSKELRAVLHERFAIWLETSGRLHEFDELVGYHLEQAQRHRLELGDNDDHTAELARRAGELLASAGSRALGRNDVHAARSLLGRAVALLPENDPAIGVRLELGQALFLSGDLHTAIETARQTADRAIAAGDDVGELRARLMLARIAAHMPSASGDEDPSAALLAVAEEARPVFARAGNELALAEAWFAAAWAQLIRARWAAMLEAVEHALIHARRAGSARWEGELPAWQGTAMFYGPTPVEEALRWYEEQQAQHPIALTQQAMLEAMRGNFDQARALVGAADTAAREFGQRLWLAAGGMAMYEIETLGGDLPAAEIAVRRSCELLDELGDAGFRWNAVGQLALSLCALERFDEAEEWTVAAEELAPKDDVASQLLWRQARARVLARRGQHAGAEQLAGEAVALVQETDMLNLHGNALADLAEVHLLAGRTAMAHAKFREALGLYEQKGNLVAAAATRRRLEELKAGTPMP